MGKIMHENLFFRFWILLIFALFAINFQTPEIIQEPSFFVHGNSKIKENKIFPKPEYRSSLWGGKVNLNCETYRIVPSSHLFSDVSIFHANFLFYILRNYRHANIQEDIIRNIIVTRFIHFGWISIQPCRGVDVEEM